MKKTRGRPRLITKPRKAQVCFEIAEYGRLEAVAAVLGLSVSALARVLILDGLNAAERGSEQNV